MESGTTVTRFCTEGQAVCTNNEKMIQWWGSLRRKHESVFEVAGVHQR